MANIINYKNRSVLISTGISDDGQANASIYYDRFDKVTYIVELDGDLVNMDGTIYTPTPIPDSQIIVNAKVVYQNGSGNPTKMRVTFEYPVTLSDLVVENFKFFGDGVELPIYSLDIRNSGENWQEQHPDNTVIELNVTDEAYEDLPIGKVYSVQASVGNQTGEIYTSLFSDDTQLNTEVIEEASLWYDTVEDTYYTQPCWWGEYDIYERTATNPPE